MDNSKSIADIQEIVLKVTEGASTNTNINDDPALEFEMISNYRPETVGIRLTHAEIIKSEKYQQAMLTFAHLQYKRAKGTPWERRMRKMYEESLEDYQEFMDKYRAELKN